MQIDGMKTSYDYDPLFAQIQELVVCHSPSGLETEIDQVCRFKV